MSQAQVWVLLLGVLSLSAALLGVSWRAIQETVRSLRAEMEARFDGMESRFDGIDRRFDEVDRRFDEVDRRFEESERRTDQRFADHTAVFEARFDSLETTMRSGFAVVDVRLNSLESDMALVKLHLFGPGAA